MNTGNNHKTKNTEKPLGQFKDNYFYLFSKF